MTISDIITTAIQSALQQLDISYDGKIHLEHPRELSHGDFATNIAMILAKIEKKNPRELAELIIEKVSAPEIASVSVAGPGFINIKLSDEFLSGELKTISEKGDFYGWNDAWKGKKI